MKEDICECIKSSKDKEFILINLDENIRHEKKEIIALRTEIEGIVKGDVIDLEKINSLEHTVDLHEKRISEIKGLVKRVEDTILCNDRSKNL